MAKKNPKKKVNIDAKKVKPSLEQVKAFTNQAKKSDKTTQTIKKPVKPVKDDMFDVSDEDLKKSEKPTKEPNNKRIETGIPGLDELIEGGLPQHSLNLLSGNCGTGKSTFAMQYLVHGAKKGEPGVYVTLEEEPNDVIKNMSRYGWNLKELIKQKKLAVVKPDLYRFEVLRRTIEDEVDRIGAKRIVIDPFSVITAYFEKIYDVRKAFTDLRNEAKKLGATSLAVSDIVEGHNTYSSSGYEEFVANGIIVLKLISKKEAPNSFVRALFVRKMESTKHSLRLVPMKIGANGIELNSDAEVF